MAQHRYVSRCGGLRQTERLLQVANAQLAVRQQRDDA
jgi:hypothetical protein